MEGVNPEGAGERLPGGRGRLINEIRRAGAVDGGSLGFVTIETPLRPLMRSDQGFFMV